MVKARIAETDEVLIPSIAVGDLYYGAWKSERVEENLKRIDELVLEATILGCGVETARLFGRLKNSLRVKCRLIPENDLWIAAITLEHNLTLVTRDTRFDDVPHLQVTVW